MAVDDERIGYVAGRLAEALERPLTGAGLTASPPAWALTGLTSAWRSGQSC